MSKHHCLLNNRQGGCLPASFGVRARMGKSQGSTSANCVAQHVMESGPGLSSLAWVWHVLRDTWRLRRSNQFRTDNARALAAGGRAAFDWRKRCGVQHMGDPAYSHARLKATTSEGIFEASILCTHV